ncbi:restriction endonuclease subunit S [Streptosporangium canum]|uniref:restriction endonuclease subunit S n=1 Tax=Streptosporangium canum TaxID=324952 RepID=UPI0033B2B7D8
MSWKMTGRGVRRVKTVATKIGSGKTPSGGAESYHETGIVFLRSQNIHFDGLRLDDVAYIDDETHREMRASQVHDGDVLLNITGASLGRVAYVPPGFGEANVNQHVCIIRPRCDIDPRFLAYALSALNVQEQIFSLQVGGNRDGLNFEQVGNLELRLPDLEEQRRIANFLDSEVARIDQLLATRKSQIELIEERALAKIFEVVRGSGQPGDRVDSGLAWLGGIPMSWPVMTVSSQFDVQLGKMLNQERSRGSHLKPYLRVANVQWDNIETGELLLMDFPSLERRRYEVLPGDLLICEGGSYPGRAAIWDGRIPEIYYQKALHRARSRGRSSVRWLYYCLRIARAMSVFEVEGNATTMTHLTGEQFAAHRFPFPDRKIQDLLVDDLDRSIEQDRILVRVLEEQLSTVAERKQALITAAVTGQIDVTTARGVEG